MGDQYVDIKVWTDQETIDKVKQVLDKLGMTIGEAVELYLKYIILNKGIPFELKIPDKIKWKFKS